MLHNVCSPKKSDLVKFPNVTCDEYLIVFGDSSQELKITQLHEKVRLSVEGSWKVKDLIFTLIATAALVS